MDCRQVGKLILTLRKEKGLTQQQLAEALNISDKTISKWERGLGCPDVSLLNALSKELGVSINKILLGNLEPNNADGGNMKRTKFYVCSNCNNTIITTGNPEISCCGRKLTALNPKPVDENHGLMVEEVENDLYITFSHPMEKNHYISFVAYVTYDRILLVKLYPEQGGEVRF
ncbi:MAG: helix-turn-helix domain-containing protein, partial [Eubacteriaceae bacterium]